MAQLLSSLFNLGAQTDFWNSSAAARDFWIVVVALAGGAVYFFTRKVRRHRRGQHFGHGL